MNLRALLDDLGRAYLPAGMRVDEVYQAVDPFDDAVALSLRVVDERSQRSVVVAVVVTAQDLRQASRYGGARGAPHCERSIGALQYAAALLRPLRPVFRIGLRAPKRLQLARAA